MIVTLLSVKERSFVNKQNEEQKYYWYKAKRADGVSIQVGCPDGELPLNVSRDFPIEKYEKKDNSIGYRILAEDLVGFE